MKTNKYKQNNIVGMMMTNKHKNVRRRSDSNRSSSNSSNSSSITKLDDSDYNKYHHEYHASKVISP